MQKPRIPATRSSLALDYTTTSFLVVDDQQFSRNIVRSVLAGFGSREIYESANAVEALELARNVMPSIIITDLVMPNSNGMKLITRLKAPESPARQIPIIVLSGYLTRSAALSILNACADEILVKPVSPKALHERITRIMLRQRQDAAPAPIARSRPQRTEAERSKSEELAYL